MFRELARKLKRITVEPVPYDPSALGDEIAMRTGWGPARGGGASFRTHRLVEVAPDRREFRATRGAVAFYLIFLVVGLGTIVGFSLAGVANGFPSGSGSLIARVLPFLVGTVFAGAGGALLYSGAAPIVFDRRRGDYWKGRRAPYEVTNRSELEEWVELDRIHALQIVSEHCRSDDSSYYSYELNIVLDDGSRLNVVDHGNRAELRADAEALAAFLERPLWDATG